MPLLRCLFLTMGLVVASSLGYQSETLKNTTRPAVFCYINGTRLLNTPHFNLQHLKLDLCTHIIYAAAVLDYHSWGIKSIDSDLQNQQSVSSNKISFHDIISLKHRNPRGMDLKILLSVTGNPADFSNMARNYGPQFVQNAATFITNSGFDGLNIDWRFPTRRGGQPQDRDKFTELMKDLKGKIRASGKILTASISPLRQTVMEAYDIASTDMMECVDYWFILAFEYYGHWSYAIGANAPIRSREKFGVEKTIDDLTDLFGSNTYRLILTIPFYGKKYQLRESLGSSSESPINAPFMNTAASPETSSLTYREICQRMTDDSWRQGWDSDGQVPYIVRDTSVIVFDDAQSVAAKTRLALRKGLGGVMAFSIDMDDYLGNCMEKYTRNENNGYNNAQDRSDRKFPLLQSMFDTVQRGPNSAGHETISALVIVLSVAGALLMARTRG